MRSSQFFIAIFAILSIALTAGCGGGSNAGPRIPDNPLVITSSSLPTTLSGEPVDFSFPLAGGCDTNNPEYVVEVIDGTLPEGIGILQGAVAKLEGFALEAGIFAFTIKITDTNCTPFSTTTQAYTWEIGVGDLVIVGANPDIILNADYDDPQKYGDIDALETVVFSSFVAYNLIPAGGVPPYVCSVVDDPNDPDDGDLPLGVGLAPNSCSIVGQPVQVLPGGVPFRVTFRATDSVGSTVERKFQWKIDTPPIIISNVSLADGKAGTAYADAIQIVDGVPPFNFQLTDNAPNDDGDSDTTDNVNDNISYPPGLTPTINGFVNGGLPFQLTNTGPVDSNARLNATTGRVGYPATNDDGPNYGPMPSEGIYLRESGAGAGSFFGTPRRRGSFTMYVHAYSTLVPNERGQHAFKALSHTIDPSEPPAGANPAFGMNPGFTMEGAFNPTDPSGSLAEAEVRVLYNPDVGSHPNPGMKLLADGGVPNDGHGDAPHEAERNALIDGIAGEYIWQFDDTGTPLPEMGMLPENGVFGVTGDQNNLVRSGVRPVAFTVNDYALPDSVNNEQTRQFEIAVGPDLVVVTESAKQWAGTTFTGGDSFDPHDNQIKIRTFEVLGGSATFGNLADSNLAATQPIPSSVTTTGLGDLLSGTGGEVLDLLRPSVLPAGWWNDHGTMNPKGGRTLVGADNQTSYNYYGAGYQTRGGWNASVSAVTLPETPSVAHDPANGVYNDGGKLYFFQSNGRFGMFIVRKDTKFFVPFAFDKGHLGYVNFGDGVIGHTGNFANDTRNSALNAVPVAISPDGRYATVKIVTNVNTSSMTTIANRNNGALVLISLTGEKFQNGQCYQVIDYAAEGTYAYSTSLVMTDQMIYCLTGNEMTSLGYEAYRGHFVHEIRYRDSAGTVNTGGGIVGGDTAPSTALATGSNASEFCSSGTPMQTPFHRYWDATDTTSVRIGTSFSFTTVTIASTQQYLYDGWNMGENSTAVVPFRVSADGNHCALMGGANTTSSSGSTVFQMHAWVSSNGGQFRQVSTAKRTVNNAGSRGYTIRRGPRYEPYGWYSGPTPGLEIADDGSVIAYVYNTETSPSATSNSSGLSDKREDIALIEGTGAASDPFATSVERLITTDIFSGTGYIWKFGSLVFTKDNQGLIFWAGVNGNNPTRTGASTSLSTNNGHNHMFYGTYYAYDINTLNQVRGIIPANLGGVGTFPTYSSSSRFTPASTPAYGGQAGRHLVAGGFISRNRNYFYFTSYAGVSSGSVRDQTSMQLIGINVENLDNASTPSGHTTGRAFRPGDWPERHGFLPKYYYSYYLTYYSYWVPSHAMYGGMQRMDANTGNVFWLSHYQASGPSQNASSTSSFASGPTVPSYWADYGYRGAHLEGFAADVGGPVSRLSHAGLGGNTSSRAGRYLVLSPDGKNIAYSMNAGGSINSFDRETVGAVFGVEFDPVTGALVGTPDAFSQESSNSRGGESMAFSSSSNKLFYAWQGGSGGNEDDKQMVEMTRDMSAGTNTTLRFGPRLRYNVLYAGR